MLVGSLAFQRGTWTYRPGSKRSLGWDGPLARKEPKILVNAVAPGFIDTNMPKKIIAMRGIENVIGEMMRLALQMRRQV